MNNGELVALETELTDTHISGVCGYNSNKWLSPAMELFARLIRETLN